MRGRKPVPTALKMLRGNPGRRPIRTDEPTAPALPATTEAPRWLDRRARGEWARVAPILAGAGLLTALDADALALLCRASADYQDALKKLKTKGIVVTTPNGYPTVSPYLAIANKSLAVLRSLLSDFGMSPAARSRVTRIAGSLPGGDAPNPLDKYLRR